MMKFFSVIDDYQIYSKSSFEIIIHLIEKKACVGPLEEEYEMISSVKRNNIPV